MKTRVWIKKLKQIIPLSVLSKMFTDDLLWCQDICAHEQNKPLNDRIRVFRSIFKPTLSLLSTNLSFLKCFFHSITLSFYYSPSYMLFKRTLIASLPILPVCALFFQRWKGNMAYLHLNLFLSGKKHFIQKSPYFLIQNNCLLD